MQAYNTLLTLGSFSVTTPQIIYPFTALGGRYLTLFVTAFNDDAVDNLLLFIDFSEDGVTADSNLQIPITIPALASRITRVDDLGPTYIRVTAESGKAGHASISGRRMITGWTRW